MLNGLVPPLITAAAAALLLWCRQIYVRRGGRRWHADIGAALGIVCVTALLELAMGRTLTYRNGPIRPWVSEVHSDQNSQQISDWYTFSHIIHGALFYGVTHLTMGPASLGMRAAVAVAIEATWESYENTGFNPITRASVVAVRRRVAIDRELPMKDAYATFVRARLA